jgi:type IV pilus assembly protein PilE
VRMEQRMQDGNTNAYSCPGTLGAATNFALACAITGGGTGYQITATGSGPVAGYAFRINEQGIRTTVSHPHGVPATNCWSTRGSACDS